MGFWLFCSISFSAWKFQEDSDFGHDSALGLRKRQPHRLGKRVEMEHSRGSMGWVRGLPGGIPKGPGMPRPLGSTSSQDLNPRKTTRCSLRFRWRKLVPKQESKVGGCERGREVYFLLKHPPTSSVNRRNSSGVGGLEQKLLLLDHRGQGRLGYP